MTHYIIKGGLFDRAADDLLATGFQLNWQSGVWRARTRPKGKSKVKYTCPACGQNAWAKPEASLVCGECGEEMEAQESGGYELRIMWLVEELPGRKKPFIEWVTRGEYERLLVEMT